MFEMRTSLLVAFILALFIYYVNATAYDSSEYSDESEYEDDQTYRKLTTIVQGYVYCQDCHGIWNKSSSAALVGVQCTQEDGSVAIYGQGYTDETGSFHIKFPYWYKSVYGPESCKALILASPDKACNTLTNVGNGKQGAPLHFHRVFMGEVYFKTGPFAFMPYCPKY